MQNAILRWAWIGNSLFGIVLIGAGAFMAFEGRAAYAEVRSALASERIVTPEDATIPGALVTGPAEAKAQSDVIWAHVMESTGGKTYAELDRADPLRATYLNSVTLRTALMESYLAFKTADLVTGIGAIIALLGASQVVLGAFLGLLARRGSDTGARRCPVITPVAAPLPS